MAVLDSIVNPKDQAVVVKSLVTTQKEVSTILKFLVTKEKNAAKEKKALAQKEKRERADFAARERKKARAAKNEVKQKGGKGILDDILGGLAGTLAAISAPVLLGALGIGAIGAAIAGYIMSPEFRKFVNQYILKPIGDFFVNEIPKLLENIKETIFKTPAARDAAERAGGYNTNYKGRTAPTGENNPVTLKEVERALGQSEVRRRKIYGDPNSTDAEREKIDARIAKLQKIIQVQYDIANREGDIRKKEAFVQNKIENIERLTQQGDKEAAEVLRKEVREHQEEITSLNEELKKQNEYVLRILEDPDVKTTVARWQGKQSGGPIIVPGSGSGDKVPALLDPGSFVLNRNAAGYQQGGIPTLLEPGERVYGPGQWGMKEWLMNKMIPRFQNGGEVPKTIPQSQAGSARGSNIPDGDEANPSKSNGTGVAAIIKAAEANTGLSAGVNMQCANTTRAVLRAAGHPAADKVTATGDLDVPPGNQYTKSAGCAASFAGSDMGTIKRDAGELKAGDIVLWKNTFSAMGGDVPGAITHVGIKGEGNSVYHHGFTPGWRKTPLSTTNFAMGVDLNGTAKGGSGGGNGGGGGGGGNPLMNMIQGLSNIGGAVGQVAGGILQAALDVFGPEIAMIFGNMGNLIMGGGAPGSFSQATSADGGAGNAGGGATSVNDPNAKALLNAIAEAEGTSGRPNKGYNTMFTGAQFTGDKHPRKKMAGWSDAAGRYQFLSTTWDEYNGGKDDMSPAHQDRVALDLVTKKRGVNISDGLSINEIYRLGGEWASIEGGPNMVKGGSYGGRNGKQAKYSAEKFMQMYIGYGGQQQKLQSGGIVNMRSRGGGPDISAQSEQQFIDKLAAATTPIVIPVGGGAGQQATSTTVQGQNNAPELSVNPSNNVALDLAYRLSMGAAFS